MRTRNGAWHRIEAPLSDALPPSGDDPLDAADRRAFATGMSRTLMWTLGSFSLAAIVSVVVVFELGCDVTQSHSLGAIGLGVWVIALGAVLVLTLLEATSGSWLAGVLGAGALLLGSVCLVLEVFAFQVSGLCGGWEWNV